MKTNLTEVMRSLPPSAVDSSGFLFSPPSRNPLAAENAAARCARARAPPPPP